MNLVDISLATKELYNCFDLINSNMNQTWNTINIRNYTNSNNYREQNTKTRCFALTIQTILDTITIKKFFVNNIDRFFIKPDRIVADAFETSIVTIKCYVVFKKSAYTMNYILNQ